MHSSQGSSRRRPSYDPWISVIIGGSHHSRKAYRIRSFGSIVATNVHHSKNHLETGGCHCDAIVKMRGHEERRSNSIKTAPGFNLGGIVTLNPPSRSSCVPKWGSICSYAEDNRTCMDCPVPAAENADDFICAGFGLARASPNIVDPIKIYITHMVPWNPLK